MLAMIMYMQAMQVGVITEYIIIIIVAIIVIVVILISRWESVLHS